MYIYVHIYIDKYTNINIYINIYVCVCVQMQIGLVVTFPSYYVNGLPQPSFISIDEANLASY